MKEKKYIPLSILNSMDKNIVESLLTKPIEILCKNFSLEQNETKNLDVLSKKNSNFWNDKNSPFDYYILEDELINLDVLSQWDRVDTVYDNYNELLLLSDKERTDLLISSKEKLEQIASNPIKSRDEINEAITSCTNVTIMLNKVVFDDLQNLNPEASKIKSKIIVSETTEIVKIISRIISSYSGDLSMFSELIKQSNGSTLQHMTRTFVKTLSFLGFYNLLIESGYVTKIRAQFNEKYRDSYDKLFLHGHNYHHVTLEKVFKGGMRAIPESDTYAIGVGFLLHDIGKQVDIDYFEGSDGSVKEIIQSHVHIGL